MKLRWLCIDDGNLYEAYYEASTIYFDFSLEPRPLYCDRGRWIAKVQSKVAPSVDVIDEQDGWPRYYMTLENAMSECELWAGRRIANIENKIKRSTGKNV
jgi:hypothetical protein